MGECALECVTWEGLTKRTATNGCGLDSELTGALSLRGFPVGGAALRRDHTRSRVPQHTGERARQLRRVRHAPDALSACMHAMARAEKADPPVWPLSPIQPFVLSPAAMGVCGRVQRSRGPFLKRQPSRRPNPESRRCGVGTARHRYILNSAQFVQRHLIRTLAIWNPIQRLLN
jgi:hypothetical protein